jgi:hypothetical protein
MAAGMGQQDRMVGDGLTESRMDRVTLDVRLRRRIPLGLVPAATEDPLPDRSLRSGSANVFDKVLPVGRLAEVENHLRLAKLNEMGVPFDESREGGLAFKFKDLRLGTDVLRDVLLCTDCDHATVATRQGLCDGAILVKRDDPATPEDEVCLLSSQRSVESGRE